MTRTGPDKPLDCLIVGGGPAGLTAAIYLARFHLDVRVIDAGDGRALSIPCTRNHAGFPEGIAGADLIARMTDQAKQYGAVVDSGRVTRLEQAGSSFEAEWGHGSARSRTVLLATGVRNRRPSIDSELHERAVAEGYLRYCPICDGYEVTDKQIGVIGTGDRGVGEAIFLRSFSSDITLLAPDGPHQIGDPERAELRELGIGLIDGPSHVSGIEDERVIVLNPQGHLSFETIYPALGSDINSSLAISLGADTSDVGCIAVDKHQRTSVPNLYAAGDVVIGLDQISHAMGEGGVAATTIRNDLADSAPILR